MDKELVNIYFNRYERGSKHDMKTIEGHLGLIHIAKLILENPEIQELYLTECGNCCGDKGTSSYRLFSEMPEAGNYYVKGLHWGRHFDTGNKGMICKCYNEERGLSERIAKLITSTPKKLTEEHEIPQEAIIYKLK